MPLRRQHGSLLVGLIATLVLIVAAPARAPIPDPPGGPILVVTSSAD